MSVIIMIDLQLPPSCIAVVYSRWFNPAAISDECIMGSFYENMNEDLFVSHFLLERQHNRQTV